MSKKITTLDFKAKKANHDKITMITAYDATFAKIIDDSEIDIILVGDSLGMVMQGHPHTLEVILEHMVYHCRCVSRVAKRVHIVGDMPFLTYQASAKQALKNAGKLISQGGAHSIKLEGYYPKTINKIVGAGIPVMGHLGLTPQSFHQMGGFKLQGKTKAHAELLLTQAKDLENAGAFAITLEGLPTEVAKNITQALTIPTIGIGAGKHCDGQVLVLQDMLGLDPSFSPKFVRQFANLHDITQKALASYVKSVQNSDFPNKSESF